MLYTNGNSAVKTALPVPAQKRRGKVLNLFHSAYLRNAFADRC
jgi:hypothetical protein